MNAPLELRTAQAAIEPLPNSRKVYAEGSRADIRVPMREIIQSDTPASFGAEVNPPIVVYDTSGPYTDPACDIDVQSGLPNLRERWIAERGDSEESHGIRRAKPGNNVTQMHYARRGIVTPEMEFIAIRENQQREGLSELLTKQHPGQDFGAQIPSVVTPEFVRAEV